MNTTLAPALFQQLAGRVESLGLVLLTIKVNGQTRPLSDCPWFERVLVTSPLWTARVRQHREQMDREACTTLWPGVHLVCLTDAQQGGTLPTDDLLAALMLSPEVIDSDELRLVCDTARLDHRATVTRIERDRLVHSSEVQRLAITLRWSSADNDAAQKYRHELHDMSGELATTYEELSLLYKLSSSMTLDQSPQRFFAEACAELHEVMGVRWLALRLIADETRLEDLADECWTAGAVPDDRDTVHCLGVRLLQEMGSRTAPLILDDLSKLGEASGAAQRGLLAVPLRVKGKLIGVMFACDRLDGEHFTSIDAKLCASLCNTLSIFIENTMLYGDVQAMFLGTLQALTAAIDAKDAYTYGHSERVALLSQMLATKAGLGEATAHRIYLAGLIHDVGKIGVPEAVLCKPGRLTDDEFDIIKTHPQIGANILRGIRQMSDLIPGVMHHHEKWDGRGYPHQLAGHDIPLFGRVIGLADAFDAMSSNRTYRSALSPDRVLDEIRLGAGSQFDPELARVFLTLDFEPFREMIQRHRTSGATFGGTRVA